ncbi:MAG: hypothetical protein D3924_05230 [Candidatus Electrothrix sp. AR4]|nr:hypothetical protein [Candidatus Electrothrix sp. AR4]
MGLFLNFAGRIKPVNNQVMFARFNPLQDNIEVDFLFRAELPSRPYLLPVIVGTNRAECFSPAIADQKKIQKEESCSG